MATLVEFFGVPAAGKSTVRDAVRARLEADGHEVVDALGALRQGGRSRAVVLAGRLRVAVQHPRSVSRSARLLWRSDRRVAEKINALKLVLITLEAADRAHRDASDRVYLLDEGLIQRTFLLAVDASAVRSDALPFGPTDPFGDVLVFVDTAPTEALRRIAARERGVPPRMEALGELELLATFDAGRSLMIDVAGTVAAAPRPRRGPVRLERAPDDPGDLAGIVVAIDPTPAVLVRP